MLQFTYCTLTSRSTGVTVDIIQGHAEWRPKYITAPTLAGLEYIMTDIWLDLGGKHESLNVETSREYVVTQKNVMVLLRAYACWEEFSMLSVGSEERRPVLHLYVDSCKKI